MISMLKGIQNLNTTLFNRYYYSVALLQQCAWFLPFPFSVVHAKDSRYFLCIFSR